GGRGAAGNIKSVRLRSALVIVEVALSLVVLVGAGLLIKSFNRLMGVETGVKSQNLFTAGLTMVEFKDPPRPTNLADPVIARSASFRGFGGAGGASALPRVTARRVTLFAVQGSTNESGALITSYFITASPDYFRALGTRMVEGREFTPRDDAAAAKVVIINRTMARNLFPNESAVGKRLQIVNSEQSNEWREIVGVVGDVRYSGLDDPGAAA